MEIFFNKEVDRKKIKNIITALLKSKQVSEIKKYNYIASYTLENNTIKKEQQKKFVLLGIKNPEKVINTIEKIIGKNYQIIDEQV